MIRRHSLVTGNGDIGNAETKKDTTELFLS